MVIAQIKQKPERCQLGTELRTALSGDRPAKGGSSDVEARPAAVGSNEHQPKWFMGARGAQECTGPCACWVRPYK